MRKILNYFLGYIQIRVQSSYPERFLNLCARNGIEFWDMELVEVDAFIIKLLVKDFRKIPGIAKKASCKIHITQKYGLPFKMKKFRRRNVFLLGAIAFFIIAWVSTAFVWSIDINGFPELDAIKLRNELEKEGLKVGAYVSGIDVDNLKNSVLINMPELAYVYVNFNGPKASVTARKRTPRPEILDSTTPCDIIADKDGVIYEITVKSGSPMVEKGATVTKGELLASGYMTGRAGTTILTAVDAEIRARVWHRLSARIPKSYKKKEYTGNEKKVYTLNLFGNRIKLYRNSGISYIKCDKIIKENWLTVGDIKTPISIECATLSEYELSDAVLSDEEAFSMLESSLDKGLTLPDGAFVSDTNFKTSSDEKFAYATLITESIEDIGVKRKILKE